MPSLYSPPSQVISSFSINALGDKFASLGNEMNNQASTAWPSANLAIYVPFYLTSPFTIQQLFWLNGAAVSGNVDMGVFDRRGTKLVSTGSTLQAGTTSMQSVTLGTPLTLGVGLFFLGMAVDNIAAAIFGVPAGNIGFTVAVGVYQQATAFPLPARATFATPTFDFVPSMAITSRSFI